MSYFQDDSKDLKCASLIESSRGVFRGAILPWPLWPKIFFLILKKNWKTWFGPLCMSTSCQWKFGPPFRNPKYATGELLQTTNSLMDFIQFSIFSMKHPHLWVINSWLQKDPYIIELLSLNTLSILKNLNIFINSLNFKILLTFSIWLISVINYQAWYSSNNSTVNIIF